MFCILHQIIERDDFGEINKMYYILFICCVLDLNFFSELQLKYFPCVVLRPPQFTESQIRNKNTHYLLGGFISREEHVDLVPLCIAVLKYKYPC